MLELSQLRIMEVSSPTTHPTKVEELLELEVEEEKDKDLELDLEEVEEEVVEAVENTKSMLVISTVK